MFDIRLTSSATLLIYNQQSASNGNDDASIPELYVRHAPKRSPFRPGVFVDMTQQVLLKQVKSNQRKNHHQKRNHQVVEVTTMKVMLMVIMMDMSVVIVLKLKLVDGLNIMVVKLHVKIEMVHMILNLMMVNVNQVLKQVKSNQRKNHHQKRNHQVVEVTTMKVMRPRLEGNWQKVWLYKQDLWKVRNLSLIHI